ncbi:MAG: PCRF domain-containing protein, partial [Candidatus Gallimonas sp.]
MFRKLEEIQRRYEETEKLLSSPEIYADTERYARLCKERAEAEEIVEKFREYRRIKGETDAALAEAEKESGEMKALLLEEGYACKARAEELEKELKLLLLPKDKNDERNCTLEIRAGAGGEEAALFAYELYRMYMGFCEKHRFSWEVVDLSETELGGMKEAVVNISGKGAYKRLKYESGVHRVQRVPETESQGR